MWRQTKHGERWYPERADQPGHTHARGGCGGIPRTGNPDRVTCPTCLVPTIDTDAREVEDDQ